jgi:hypothetical protein
VRVVVALLLLLALVAQSLVIEPTSAVAQVTEPPPGEAASIRIDEPDVPVGDADVSVPANLMIDPDAGIAQDAPLQLVVGIAADEQPLAGSSVSVTAAATTPVETDAQGQFRILPLDLGTWQQLTSPDGVDFVLVFDAPAGAVTVTFELVTEGGDAAAPLSPVTTRTFDVEPDGETLAGRIEDDHDAGVLSADDAARYSLLSAIDPDYRAAPYADLYDDEIPEDPQALGLFAVTLYSEVSAETRAELQDYLTVDPLPGGGSAGPDASSALDPADYPDCFQLDVAWRCVTEVDSSDPETGGDPIDLVFGYTLGNGQGQVEDVDQDANQRPDQIDSLIDSFVDAWRFYRDDLGMNALDDTITVQLLDTPNGSGLSLPGISGGGTIFIPPTADPYLVRHELFHQVQYQYLSPADIAAHFHPMGWLMESSAEWAAYEAEQQLGPGNGRRGRYAGELAQALGAPHRTLDDTDQLVGGPEYGSFPFIEYLDQEHGQYAGVEAVLAGSGEGAAGHRPTDVIADHVGSWADAIVEYRQWTYLLTRDDNYSVGFDAPDSDSNGTDDIDEHWRAALQDDPRTAGVTQQHARPARTARYDFSSVQERFSASGYANVYPGGARYIEIELPADTPSVDIDIETESSDIHTTALLTSTYPQLCQTPTTVHTESPGSEADVIVDPDCNRLVLIVTNTAQPGIGQGAQQMRYSARTGAISGHLDVDGEWRTLTFTESVWQHRLTFEADAGQRLRVAFQYRPVVPWFYVLDPNGYVMGGNGAEFWYPDFGLSQLEVDGQYTLVIESNPDSSTRFGELGVRVYDQQVPTEEFYPTYGGDVGILEAYPSIPYTDPVGDGRAGESEIVGLNAEYEDDRVRVEVTLSSALQPSEVLRVDIYAGRYGHGPAAQPQDIGVWQPTGGPCSTGAGWSQSGLTYIYEVTWPCDFAKIAPWMHVRALRGVDEAPDDDLLRFPPNPPAMTSRRAGPVPGWGTVPSNITRPEP